MPTSSGSSLVSRVHLLRDVTFWPRGPAVARRCRDGHPQATWGAQGAGEPEDPRRAGCPARRSAPVVV